jgi:hypothetical protein
MTRKLPRKLSKLLAQPSNSPSRNLLNVLFQDSIGYT